MRRGGWLLAMASSGAIATASSASAQDATSYTYDALGRLITTSVSGGPNNAINAATCFDPAGNRSHYIVSVGSNACAGTPTLPHTPTPHTDTDQSSTGCGK